MEVAYVILCKLWCGTGFIPEILPSLPHTCYQSRRINSGPAGFPISAGTGTGGSCKRKDTGILITIVLSATALSCGLLNLLVFTGTSWSLLIIGICILLFVFAFPAVIYTKLPIYLSLLFDGIAIGVYLYMITYLTPSARWFWQLAVPIVLLVTVLVEIFTFFLHKLPISIISTALYIFAEAAILCVGIELFIRRFAGTPCAFPGRQSS